MKLKYLLPLLCLCIMVFFLQGCCCTGALSGLVKSTPPASSTPLTNNDSSSSSSAASTESSEGATMFCTHAPCINCAKLIYQSGINSLYYRNTYRDTAGIEFLEKSGVSVTKYET